MYGATGFLKKHPNPMQHSSHLFLRIFFSVILGLSITSCQKTVSLLVGFRQPHVLTDKEQIRFLKKLNADPSSAYFIDSTYFRMLNMEDTVNFIAEKKNHYQPIQVIYYGHGLQPESWIINCYTQGFPNLKWNADGKFGSFPPKAPTPLDTLVSFDRLFQYAKPLKSASRVAYKTGADQPYTVVIYWNRMMFRQCKRLNLLVQSNLRETGKPYRLLYVNNDALFSDKEITGK